MASPLIPGFPLSLGCLAAQTDASHDFKNEYPNLSDLVQKNLPGRCAADKNHKNEDQFVAKSLLASKDSKAADALKITPVGDDTSTRTADRINVDKETIFSEEIRNFYDIIALDVPQVELMQPTGESAIQMTLQEKGIVEDVFIVCDVVNPGIKLDLSKAKGGNQTFWWVSNTQTGFDPALKLQYNATNHNNEPWFKGNFRFAWSAVSSGIDTGTLYPKWPEAADSVPSGRNNLTPNEMLTVNKDLFMITRADDAQKWNYKKHESYLVVDNGNNKYVHIPASLASKNPGIMNNFSALSYKKEATEMIKALFGYVTSEPIRSRLPNLPALKALLVDNFTTEYHVLAKRCGDMPQALVCLRDKFQLQTLLIPYRRGDLSKDNVGAPDLTSSSVLPSNKITNNDGDIFESNGNHMFASFDRIAIAQSLNYRVPFVFYDQKAHEPASGAGQAGLRGILFIEKSLVSKGAVLESIAKGGVDALDIAKKRADGSSFPPLIEGIGASITQFLNAIDVTKEATGATENMLVAPKWNTSGEVKKQQLKDETLRQYLGVMFCNIQLLDQFSMIEPLAKSFQDGEYVRQQNQAFINAYGKLKGVAPELFSGNPPLFLGESVFNIPEDTKIWFGKFGNFIITDQGVRTAVTSEGASKEDKDKAKTLINDIRNVFGVLNDYNATISGFIKGYKDLDGSYGELVKNISASDSDYVGYIKQNIQKGMLGNIKDIKPSLQDPPKNTNAVVPSIIGLNTVLEPIIKTCEGMPTSMKSVSTRFENNINTYLDELIEYKKRRTTSPRTFGKYATLLQQTKNEFNELAKNLSPREDEMQEGGTQKGGSEPVLRPLTDILNRFEIGLDAASRSVHMIDKERAIQIGLADKFIKNLMNIFMSYLYQKDVYSKEPNVGDGDVSMEAKEEDKDLEGLADIGGLEENITNFIRTAGNNYVFEPDMDSAESGEAAASNNMDETPDAHIGTASDDDSRSIYIFNALRTQAFKSGTSVDRIPHFTKELILYLNQDDPSSYAQIFKSFFELSDTTTLRVFSSFLNMNADQASQLKRLMNEILSEKDLVRDDSLERHVPSTPSRHAKNRSKSPEAIRAERAKRQGLESQQARAAKVRVRRGIKGGRRTRKHRKNNKKRTTKRKRSRIKRKRSRRKKRRERKKKKRTVKSR